MFIKTISKFITFFIPVAKIRRKTRKFIYNFLLDYTNQIHYSCELLCGEYKPKDTLIQSKDKILIIAPHPDDDCIGCGGIIAKYFNQVDVLCINSSGVKYDWDTKNAEQIADERIKEFHNVMDFLGVKKRYIFKIFGKPPHFDKIKNKRNEYLSTINFKKYQYIFIPDRNDSHREHSFLSNSFIPSLLKEQGYNKKTCICYYGVWSTVTNPNYFEDITNVLEKKKSALLLYKSRMTSEHNYAKRVTGLNYYYGLLCNSIYAEAFRVEKIKSYLRHKDDRRWAHL